MGVDAEMLVIPNTEINDEELKNKSYIFGSAFHYNLMIGFDNNIYHRPIYRAKDDEYINEWIPKDALKIPLSGRYYGKGYARGPLMTYVAMAELLEVLFPNCKILYYGDAGGCESAVEFDKEYRKDLIQFFAQSGCDSYSRYFDNENDGPQCPVCDIKMIRNGWGYNFKYFTCSGCGWNVREKDGVKSEGFNLKGL